MDHKGYSIKQCKANDIECILLYRLLNIPAYISEHPNFKRLIIVYNPISNKLQKCNGKFNRVKHYCSIDINAKLDNILELFKDNPYLMDYNVFEKLVNPISSKKTGKRKYEYSTHLLFWIPSEKQKDEYE